MGTCAQPSTPHARRSCWICFAMLLSCGVSAQSNLPRQRLFAPDAVAQDRLGTAVAIWGDTLVLGAPEHASGQTVGSGAAYVYTRVAGRWLWQQTLSAEPFYEALGECGRAVAIRGDRIAVGCPGASGPPGSGMSRAGAVLVFERSGSRFAQTAKLFGSPAQSDNAFGRSLALGDDELLVGETFARSAFTNQTGAGRVQHYVFATSWTIRTTYSGAGTNGEQFGFSVAMAGNRAVIGTPFAAPAKVWLLSRSTASNAFTMSVIGPPASTSDFGWAVAVAGDDAIVGAPGEAGGVGAAHVYRYGGATWAFATTLRGSGLSARFGESAAMQADAALIGEPLAIGTQGSAWLFGGSGNSWSLGTSVSASDGVIGERLGAAVAMTLEGTLLLGAPSANFAGTTGQFEGSAVVFDATIEETALTDPNGTPQQSQGAAIATGGNVLVAGVPGDQSSRGKVIVYERIAGIWAKQADLVAPNGVTGDKFGASVSVSRDGGAIAVGAPDRDVQSPINGVQPEQGAVYTFDRSGSSWALPSSIGEVLAPDGDAGDRFGAALDLDASGEILVVGAPLRVVPGSVDGAAYKFRRTLAGPRPAEAKGAGWGAPQPLLPPTAVTGDKFASAVAFGGGHTLLGAPGRDAERGAAFLFTDDVSGVAQPGPTLTNDNGAAGDAFGSAVAISDQGHLAAIGSPGDDVATRPDQGSVQMFDPTGTGPWQEVGDVSPPGITGDKFGTTVAVDGNTTLVGAPLADPTFNPVDDDAGAAWLIRRDDVPPPAKRSSGGASFVIAQQLTASARATNAAFGAAVALVDGVLVVGAPAERVGTNAAQGRSYVFRAQGLPDAVFDNGFE